MLFMGEFLLMFENSQLVGEQGNRMKIDCRDIDIDLIERPLVFRTATNDSASPRMQEAGVDSRVEAW